MSYENQNFAADPVAAALSDLTTSIRGLGVEEMKARLMDVEQRLVSRPGGYGSASPATWGHTVADSEEFKNWAAAGGRGTARIQVKAITSVDGSAGPMIAPDVRPDVTVLPRQRLTVRDLLSQSRTGSNMVQFPRMTSRTNAAAPVAEGALKPESAMAFELAEAPVRTIAHWVVASRQSLDDAAQLVTTIDEELRYGLAIVEEAQLLAGNGTGQNILGLIPQATAYDVTRNGVDDTRVDTIHHALAQAEEANLPASGVVLNSRDWAGMTALKDADGQYLGNGPFSAQPPTLWGVPVVPTPAIAQGTFLVGAFRMAATIYDRMDPEVLLSSEDGDNFRRNMLTILAEQRLALAVRQPLALITGSYPV